ncbi:hypothetical protein [Salinicoccus roseus]|uniref:hypothetical protein n=1 Tax=Salinicoccus roseus TaxID=45670 RepID=UPI003566F798
MTISNPLLIFFLGMLAYLGAKLIDFFIAKVYEYMWNAHVKDWFVRGLNSGSRVIAWIEASPLFNSIFRSIFMKDIEYGEYEGEERYFSVRDKVITELATMMEPGRYYTFSELFAALAEAVPDLHDPDQDRLRVGVLQSVINHLDQTPVPGFEEAVSSDSTKRFKYTNPGS